MKKFVVALILLFVVSGYAYAQSAKEDYELQERCGKRTEERFKKEYGNATAPMVIYTNHYNRKLNKCFILVTERVKQWDRELIEKLGVSITYKTLDDINENKPYGFFWKFSKGTIMECEVLGKRCNSESEWDALVKPYMEE